MRCFQVVKIVLDDLFNHIPAASDKEKYRLILAELEELTYSYKRGVLDINDDGIDYSNIVRTDGQIVKEVAGENIQWYTWGEQYERANGQVSR